MTEISQPASREIKPEQRNSSDKTGASQPNSKTQPLEKKKKKGPSFNLATIPDFRGFHFRENKSTCSHKYTTIPVCAPRVDERDWATSTSHSLYSTLLECVTCICPPSLIIYNQILLIKICRSMLIIRALVMPSITFWTDGLAIMT